MGDTSAVNASRADEDGHGLCGDHQTTSCSRLDIDASTIARLTIPVKHLVHLRPFGGRA